MTKPGTDFLEAIQASKRGKLKVFLGYSTGVGKTCAMLREAHGLRVEGVDVVAGFVETHEREETRRLLDGIEVIPCRIIEYAGIQLEEMDVEAVLERRPQVALVDEMAHSNLPGSLNSRRYEDIVQLLAAGIHVLTTMNIQHLESLHRRVEDLTGHPVYDRVPDYLIRRADCIVNVDIPVEELLVRFRGGTITRDGASPGPHYRQLFKNEHLQELRDMTLQEAGELIRGASDRSSGEVERLGDTGPILVCLSALGANNESLVRYGAQLAEQMKTAWTAFHLQEPEEAPEQLTEEQRASFQNVLKLAEEFGGDVVTFKGKNPADSILRYAREHDASAIVIGRSSPPSFLSRLTGRRSLMEIVIERAEDISVVVVNEPCDKPAAP